MRTLVLIAFALLAISCSKKTAPTGESKPVKADVSAEAQTEEEMTAKDEAAVKADYENRNYIPATVINMEALDGCGFMLKLENGKKLQPTPALTEEFSVDRMPVWIKYQFKKGAVGICMSGQIVTLSEIVKR